VDLLYRDAKLLRKAISDIRSLSKEERERVKSMMLEEQAKDLDGLVTSMLDDSLLLPVGHS
jgi:hypothetical protein